MRCFVEIGVENIPANLVDEILAQVDCILKNDNFTFIVQGSCKRIQILAYDLKEKIVTVEEIQGPKCEASNDVILKFIEKHNINETKIVEKGDKKYLVGIRRIATPIESFITEKIKSIFHKLEFAVTMVWSGIKFIRPVRYIVAFLEDKMLSFQVGDLTTSNCIKIKNKKIVINSFSEYININLIKNAMQKKQVLSIFKHSSIYSEIVHNLEDPKVVFCSFDTKFLSIPSKVIQRTISIHQFGLVTNENNFVVACEQENDSDLVKAGNERVVTSRLQDAELFLNEDSACTIEQFIEKLKNIYIEKESVWNKQNILSMLIKEYTDNEDLIYAALICKFDLATAIIKEKDYAELRGYIAKEYALKRGISYKIAEMLEDHYYPRFKGDVLPKNRESAILGVLDKAINIALHPIPSGAKDPFYLRREATAILTLIETFDLDFDLLKLFQKLSVYFNKSLDVSEFFKNRILNLDFDKVLVNAVIQYWSNYKDMLARLNALQNFDLEEIKVIYTRLSNLSKEGDININILNDLELKLYSLSKEILSLSYIDALEKMRDLKYVLDQFFDKIVVMVEDTEIRNNRLALLDYVRKAMNRVGNLDRIFRG